MRLRAAILCTVAMVVLSQASIAIGQSEYGIPYATGFEDFSSQDGTLIQKQYVEIGRFGESQGIPSKVKIQAATVVDLITEDTVRAMRLTRIHSYRDGTQVAILDIDEVASLQTAIRYIKEKVVPTRPNTLTEVTFKSRGGFSIGYYWSDNQWKGAVQLIEYNSNPGFAFDASEFADILELVELCRSHLKP